MWRTLASRIMRYFQWVLQGLSSYFNRNPVLGTKPIREEVKRKCGIRKRNDGVVNSYVSLKLALTLANSFLESIRCAPFYAPDRQKRWWRWWTNIIKWVKRALILVINGRPRGKGGDILRRMPRSNPAASLSNSFLRIILRRRAGSRDDISSYRQQRQHGGIIAECIRRSPLPIARMICGSASRSKRRSFASGGWGRYSCLPNPVGITWRTSVIWD